MKKKKNGKIIEIKKGDITQQSDMIAIVNAANAELLPGGGVAGAIHRAAGPELVNESAPQGPIKPGQAVITKAYNLPNQFIIHCLGPVYGKDKPEEELLANCYANSLKVADWKSITSIAFPAISTGAFAYPLAEAADIAIKTILHNTSSLKKVKIIRMVLFSEMDYKMHLKAFEKHLKKK